MVAKRKCIETPSFLRDTDSAQQRQRVSAPREAWARHSELLTGELKHAPIVEAPAIKSPVKIGVLVSGGDIYARVWVGIVGAPAAHVDPQLAGTSLYAEMLKRPQLDGREIENPTCSTVEVVDLDPVVEHPDALEIGIVGSRLRRRQPARPERGHPRNTVQQIDHRESSRRKELLAVPFVLRSDLVECRVGKAADGWLDRIGFDLDRIAFVADAVGTGVGFWLRRDRDHTNGGRGHLCPGRKGSRVQKRPGHEAEAGWGAQGPGSSLQRTLPRMNSMKVPVGTPVGPLGIVTRSVSE